MEKERQRETSVCERDLNCSSRTHPDQDQGRNLQPWCEPLAEESNPGSFAERANALSTEKHQPGPKGFFFLIAFRGR